MQAARHTCHRDISALLVYLRRGQRHLPTASFHQGLSELPVLGAIPILPNTLVLPTMPVHEGSWQTDTGCCITASLADPLRIKRQQRYKGCHLHSQDLMLDTAALEFHRVCSTGWELLRMACGGLSKGRSQVEAGGCYSSHICQIH